MNDELGVRLEALYRAESGRVLATLIRLLGDFELAEDAMHEAFATAASEWPRQGMPNNPRAWLVSTGRFKGIDKLRQRARSTASGAEMVRRLELASSEDTEDERAVADDQLRLIFTCCHPALAPDARVALTLREVCGLTTEEIARAFLTTAPAIAQRIVRAKTKIRAARIPYSVPQAAELPERLEPVLSVIYLVFNEGYSASAGSTLVRPPLTSEALRLGRLLAELLPDTDTFGLLGLMTLHESRRTARIDAEGDLVLLDEQDRARWDKSLIDEGLSWTERGLTTPPIGRFAIQAAIAAVHAAAPTAERTDWSRIVQLYDLLYVAEPTPVVALNRAVAVAMRDGAQAGLLLLEILDVSGELDGYAPLHAARADLCRRLGRHADARIAYATALRLTAQAPERRFLERRLAALPPDDDGKRAGEKRTVA